MGERVIPTVLWLLGEDFLSKPFIDLLNRLEKLGLIDKTRWMDMRKIRNEVAHDYSLNVGKLVLNLNAVFESGQELIQNYNSLYNFCLEKFDFVRESDLLLS